jgi:hypothetical protein
MNSEKPKILASNAESTDIDRCIMVWANQFPRIPSGITLIKYEYIAAKTVGLAVSAVQGAYITKKYICGGHEGEYSFELHYQIAPPGTSDSKRLDAVELLNSFGDWARENLPDIGEGRKPIRMDITSRAAYLGRTNDLYEDYLIPLKLTYEVNV